MKKSNSNSKLAVIRQTIRTLDQSELQVAGGGSQTTEVITLRQAAIVPVR